MNDVIRIRGARQNNLQHLDLDLPLGQLTVVTGVSGSGKSSLVFDTVYAEGQRRYVETFSPYARQFLDRQDRPQVEHIDGIPPAIAIDQTNPVRSSRSTVGTMTEVNDHLKLLMARLAQLHCHGCGRLVQRDTPASILHDLQQRCAASNPRLEIGFTLAIPHNFSAEELQGYLNAQGYTRVTPLDAQQLWVVQDRLRLSNAEPARVLEALEAALQHGHGQISVLAGEQRWRYSADLHCPDCDLHYSEATPGLFSFNSPIGACPHCRGFGRVIGLDLGLVIPDPRKTLAEGALRPWQIGTTYGQCYEEMLPLAKARSLPLDVAWQELSAEQQQWVIEGDPDWQSWEQSWPGRWYGVRRFFAWLESKAYKMHVRVFLSRYRAYTTCPVCQGARLKPQALDFRLGAHALAETALGELPRFQAAHWRFSAARLADLPGLSLYDLMRIPLQRLRQFMLELALPSHLDEASELLLGELRTRLDYLCQVGLGYLNLDRQSRTLSGGEVQRINLTTALGTSLVNSLFVLDEPSIGLHPRDLQRVVQIMHRLKAQGNTLLVVEHDPQIMLAADRLLDLGPGPGRAGGQIVFQGHPAQLLQAQHSRTADYLLGRLQIADGSQQRTVTPHGPRLRLSGVYRHNLRDLSLELPLGHLVMLTGVSGSGKSTLVQDVLYPLLARQFGKPCDSSAAQIGAYSGLEALGDVLLVDQSPIGKTARSNPASYVGAFDAIRALFAKLDSARQRGYSNATFSFNAGDGRCPVCQGSGFEHVEMQFLADVYLRCPECDGQRYRADVLDITLDGLSIAQVLELTVTEALQRFSQIDGGRAVVQALQPLAEVGLDYLRLGQPVPTLSGGEAQRLKLAGYLAENAKRRSANSLFIFDEPSTGLHFEDIRRLLSALLRLRDAGHSVLVVEHNLDLIAAADWVLDLGPEGGDQGGQLLFAGTPQQLQQTAHSHTGRALADYQHTLAHARHAAVAEAHTPLYRTRVDAIEVQHAREHNLKNLSVRIPQGSFSVITGPSGSGKSTLAFDIIFNEGQRRYLESLNAYARSMVQPAHRPEVDAIHGIPPTVAIEQQVSRGGRKSTVATLTEIYHFLRLLWVKLGTAYCPHCQLPIGEQTPQQLAQQLLQRYHGQTIQLLAPLVLQRKGVYSDLAKWAAKQGYSQLRVDGQLVPSAPFPRLERYHEHTIELPIAELVCERVETLHTPLEHALHYGKGVVHLLVAGQLHLHSCKRACPRCGCGFPELDPRLFSFNSAHGWCPDCQGTGVQLQGFQADEQLSAELYERVLDQWLDAQAQASTCPSCDGQRLNPQALAVRFRDYSIAQLTAQPINAAAHWLSQLQLDAREHAIAHDLCNEVSARLQFLQRVGLGYLSLARAAPTLSGGEAQRIRLAAQLGSNLQGVAYVLDEPTIGLHPRDNRILLDALDQLQQRGNTLIVVEHDEECIRRAQHVLDLGPGAGRLGGELVAEGTAEQLMHCPRSLTGRYLAQPLQHPLRPYRAARSLPKLRLLGAHRHNLHYVDALFPLGALTVVTGVSGSGKSTLAREVLLPNLQAQFASQGQAALHACQALDGWQAIARVLEVDQTPIGKTPRSCPATYVGFWDAIRALFAQTNEARLRGWNAGRFSFNTAAGRCPVCDGQGVVRVEMSFLPEVRVRCEACGGQRFSAATEEIRWQGYSIGQVLSLSVEQALELFAAHPSIQHPLQLLVDVGLGYLTLGQASPTLSGGEAQRIKLVTELAKVKPNPRRVTPPTLYVLDEPTVGLHLADVEKLIQVLQRLVDAGNTVVLIEHHLDLIAEADWILDLGPEGGDGGGRIVCQGTVAELCAHPSSHTGRALREFLAGRTA